MRNDHFAISMTQDSNFSKQRCRKPLPEGGNPTALSARIPHPIEYEPYDNSS